MFINLKCKVDATFTVAKDEFVEAFANFLYAGGHDPSLAGDCLKRAMRVKGFSSTPLDGSTNRYVKRLDAPGRAPGFFGIRLRTEEELLLFGTPKEMPKEPAEVEASGACDTKDTSA
jgi:hypothetical protein